MENSEALSWNINLEEVRSKKKLSSLTNPKVLGVLSMLFLILFLVLRQLSLMLVDEFGISRLNAAYISWGIAFVWFLFLFFVSIYKHREFKGVKEVAYKVSDEGISYNGKFHSWQEFNYFSWDEQVYDSLSSISKSEDIPTVAGEILDPQGLDYYHLTKEKKVFEKGLTVITDSYELSRKVREILFKHLEIIEY